MDFWTCTQWFGYNIFSFSVDTIFINCYIRSIEPDSYATLNGPCLLQILCLTHSKLIVNSSKDRRWTYPFMNVSVKRVNRKEKDVLKKVRNWLSGYKSYFVYIYYYNYLLTVTVVHFEGWERKRSKCFFTYIHLDLFRFHSSILSFILILVT